jgi:hypothetical protein
MPLGKKEFVFEAHIRAQDDDRDFLIEKEGMQLEQAVIKTLTVDLPNELDHLFGIKITVYIKGTRYGSLSVFFGVVLATYSVLSGYKGLYESINLIGDQATALLNPIVSRYGKYSVYVKSRYPALNNPDDWEHKIEKYFFHPGGPRRLAAALASQFDENHIRRDGFFYFLLVFSIIELAAIILLVYGAIAKTYFNP